MAELTSRKDEELVVGAAQAVLDKYGADSDLSDLLRRVRESDATAIFNCFCKWLVDHLRPLAAISRNKGTVLLSSVKYNYFERPVEAAVHRTGGGNSAGSHNAKCEAASF